MGAERVRYDHGTQLSGQSTAPSKRCTGHPVCAAVAANPQHHWGLAAAGSTRRRTGEDARGRRGRAQSSERVRRTSNGRTAADEPPGACRWPKPALGAIGAGGEAGGERGRECTGRTIGAATPRLLQVS